jgi:catechol 2,3-dioxygenase-like lactoylglutathione lyase family enzyme
LAAIFFSWLLYAANPAPKAPPRPRITGIAGVRIHVSSANTARGFYGKILEADVPCSWCERSFLLQGRAIPADQQRASLAGLFFAFNDQFVILDDSSPSKPDNFLEEIMLFTDDLAALASYLRSKSLTLTVLAEPESHETIEIYAYDPEGHRISFRGAPTKQFPRKPDDPLMRIIHAGFVVQDRVVMDKFYKDILGFHTYWHGGMKDDQTDWVDMQVPDGSDWIEYMLNVSPAADKNLRGVMNHFAVGVPDIEAASFRINKNGMKLTEEPQIGRDGKWQLNLYDPDDTRVELMEFTPVEKPCCSDYTGPHPKP